MDDGNGSFPSNIAVAVGVSKGTNNSLTGDQVRVRYFDGTLKTLTMSDKSETPRQGVAYKITGSDDNAKLEKLVGAKEYNGYKAVTTGVTYTEGQTTVAAQVTADPDSSKIGSDKVDDKAVVILYTTNGRSKVITGKQYNALKTAKLGSSTNDGKSYAVFTKKSNGLKRVQMAAVQVSSINVTGNASDSYAYIVSDGYENNGDVYYTIWDGAKNVDVIEENASASDRTQGTLIGYSSIDSNKKIADVTDYGTIDKDHQQKPVTDTTTVTSNIKVDKDHLYRGGNESTDTKTIAIDGMKFNITADTTVLRVDSDADEDADIGQAYTYGTTTMTKAQKNTDGTYTYNVFFVMDEAASKAGEDDLDLAVLVIDTTGAFKGHKIADSTPSTPSTPSSGTYAPNADTTVKVADSAIVTGAAATYNTKAGTMTVQLTVDTAYTTKEDSEITVTVNSVKQDDITIGDLADDGTVKLTVNCDKGDKVVVNVGSGAFTKG